MKLDFIDPPYNTGNENWIYNDRMNVPKIKAWLDKVAGGEEENCPGGNFRGSNP